MYGIADSDKDRGKKKREGKQNWQQEIIDQLHRYATDTDAVYSTAAYVGNT